MSPNLIKLKKSLNVNGKTSYLPLTIKEKNNYFNIFGLDKILFKYDPLTVHLVKDKEITNDNIYKIKNLVFNQKDYIHNSPASKEWTNSVYTYNKNYTKPLLSTWNMVNRMLTGYFNMNKLINGKKSKASATIEKRLSLNKVFVSKTEIKHTSDKINLTVYIYNRKRETYLNQKSYLEKFSLLNLKRKKRVKNLAFPLFLLKENTIIKNNKLNIFKPYYSLLDLNNNNIKNLSNNTNSKLNEKSLNLAYRFKLPSLNLCSNKTNLKILNKNFIKFKIFDLKCKLFIKKILILKNKLSGLNNNNEIFKSNNKSDLLNRDVSNKSLLNKKNIDQIFDKYLLKILSKYLNKFYVKQTVSLYYVKRLLSNNVIFKNWFMLGLNKSLNELYNKKVELNIVNQKYFYLNSDIFIKTIATKVKNRNNRILKELGYTLGNIKLPVLNLSYKNKSIKVNSKNINTCLKNEIFNSIKYKHIQGVRVEAAGRLTKRLIASRALFKVRNLGNIKNYDEIYNDKSALMLKGSIKPNLQYTFVNSKTRNGAFGLKGWVNSN